MQAFTFYIDQLLLHVLATVKEKLNDVFRKGREVQILGHMLHCNYISGNLYHKLYGVRFLTVAGS